MNDIGKQITALRREKNMTQEQLANLIGVSAQTVSKWECGTTMPDILLLPVLAGIFDISIDALFGIERESSPAPLHTEKTEAAIDALLTIMWCEGAPKEDARQSVLHMRQGLDSNRTTQSMWIVPNAAGIFVDAETAVVNRMTREAQIQALGRSDAVEFLSACAKPHVMRVMRYQLENSNRTFTAATAAVKCSITEEEADAALDVLARYNLTMRQTVDLPDGTITVYRLFAEYKLLLLSALLSVAGKLADYKENYHGFCCP